MTTNTPGYRAFVRHGTNRYLVPPRGALAEAIECLRQSSEERTAMGRTNVEFICDKFNLRTMADAEEYIYTVVLNQASN